jgi:catechol 2,3-dioxygenase-like lactoylglutathione lyase family enzyme
MARSRSRAPFAANERGSEVGVAVRLNHTIVHALDAEASARFLADLLGLPQPYPFGPFVVVELANGVSLDFLSAEADEFIVEHYAFLVDEAEFDAIFGRIRERGLTYWADPHKRQPNQINTHDGGRGVYWNDPNGHMLEIITRPYGSGG